MNDKRARHGGKLALVHQSSAFNDNVPARNLYIISGARRRGAAFIGAPVPRLPVRSTSCSSRTTGMIRILIRDAAAIRRYYMMKIHYASEELLEW